MKPKQFSTTHGALISQTTRQNTGPLGHRKVDLMRKQFQMFTWIGIVSALLCGICAGEDWPTYNHDVARSGVTSEQLRLPLAESWQFQATHPPKPAWPLPAKQDFWHNLHSLRSLVTFDRAFHVVVAGDAAYFGSSADDKVYCLDGATGHVRWSFFTGAPVRLAPTVANDKLYFGSDDGYIYCLSTRDGALVWKRKLASQDRALPGNGRIVSLCPVRAGVVVDEGMVYCCAGLWPAYDVCAYALDADTGEVVWKQNREDITSRKGGDEFSPQGYMLASRSRLYVPNGRTNPHVLDRATGKHLGVIAGSGGAYALLTENALLSGPGRSDKQITLSNTETRESIASFGGLRLIVSGEMAYMQSENELAAFNRVRYLELLEERKNLHKQRERIQALLEKAQKDSQAAMDLAGDLETVGTSLRENSEALEQCFVWKRPCEYPYSLILAGDTLFAGGSGEVAAFEVADGSKTWFASVNGKVYALSVASGGLFAATDNGTVYRFAAGAVVPATIVRQRLEAHPYPRDSLTDLYAKTAEQILEQSGIKKGYCLVLGSGEGRLAYELAKHASDLQIVGVEKDAGMVAAARSILDRAAYYGSRISIHYGSPANLPYPDYFANLIVSEPAAISGKLPVRASEIFRVLRPCGGVAIIGQGEGVRQRDARLRSRELKRWVKATGNRDWKISKKEGLWALLRRGPVPNSGEWTQLYCDAAHTACSADQLRGPMTIQWFGEPGPREMIDRHHRPMSSLYKNGRLFVPADNRIIAVDAYNGTPLWEREVPNSRRVGALKDSGQMLVTDEYVYLVAQDHCHAVDVADGSIKFTLKAAKVISGEDRDWGYLNCVGERLFGSGQKVGASFDRLAYQTDPNAPYNLQEQDFREVVVSDYLFSFNRFTAEKPWTYHRGTIMNSAITIGDGRIYFAECRNPEIMKDRDGRVRIDRFCERETFIVALDAQTGKKIWEQPFQFPFQHIMFLNFASNTLLFSGTSNREDKVFYDLFAFHADTGREKWHTDYRATNIAGTEPTAIGGSHGEQWQHPVINQDTIYARPYAFDLLTGEKKDYIAYRGGHGCGGLTGSRYYLYGRGSNPRMYPIETQRTEGIRLTNVTRPGCWLNLIPAGGLVLAPESSAGCSCAYPLQTSIAFAPKRRSE